MGNRRLESFNAGEKNSLYYVWKFRNPVRVFFNFFIITVAKCAPHLGFKNFLLRLTGIKIGKDASIGLAVMFDVFYPERIEIGENAIIGYSATILAHEFLQKELRVGNVKIGKNSMVGANSTVLAGVEIGEGATVSAMSLVDQDVPANCFGKGNPIVVVEKNGQR
jgi:acetyltransferase-like isoleucine patch superfamily enzyme